MIYASDKNVQNWLTCDLDYVIKNTNLSILMTDMIRLDMINTQSDLNVLSMSRLWDNSVACIQNEPCSGFKPSYHRAGTMPGPWGGHQGNWDDERDPTSRTPAVASLLLWRWSPVLQRVMKDGQTFLSKTGKSLHRSTSLSPMHWSPLYIYSRIWGPLF